MARSWRGWEGEKDWVSLESGMRLVATSDGRGHVSLWVVLAEGMPGQWSVHVELRLEAAQLDRLASAAASFCRDLGAVV